MKDYYLKTDTEEALWQVLLEAGLVADNQDPENPGFYPKQGIALDVIGTIYKPTGEMLTDEEGNEFPAMAPIPGFHANLRLIGDMDLDTLEPYMVDVKTPTRVWA